MNLQHFGGDKKPLKNGKSEYFLYFLIVVYMEILQMYFVTTIGICFLNIPLVSILDLSMMPSITTKAIAYLTIIHLYIYSYR